MGDNIDTMLTRSFDLSSVQRATLKFSLWFDIEKQFDFAYVEASRDGGLTWDVLRGKRSTDDDPLDQSFGPGYTGKSGGGDRAKWVGEEVDLTAYAGGEVLVRFEYITDQAVNNRGMAIDDIAIPEIGYLDDAESASDWVELGFVRTNNLTPQSFSLRFVPSRVDEPVQEITLDRQNRGVLDLPPNASGVLIVAAMAPVTTVPTGYTFTIEIVDG